MNLVTTAGDVVPLHATLTAINGPHTGRRFRFAGLHADGERVVMHHLNPHPFRNAVVLLHPAVFGCVLRTEVTRVRHFLNLCCHVVSRVDEWLWAGAFALLPLSMVDPEVGHHLGELFTRLFGAE